MTHLRARLLGLLASLAILTILVGAPLALIAIGVAPWDLDLTRTGRMLRSPDDGHLAMGVIAVVAWVAWAVMVVSIGTEIVARVRGVRAPQLPGLAVPQEAAWRLVAVASMLFIAVPAVAPLLAPPPTHGAASAHIETTEPTPSASAQISDATPAVARSVAEPELATVDYTVRRGDTLWKIADQHLADGARWREIFDLNREVLGDRPDFIMAGTLLRLPYVVDESGPGQDETYVVETGDTLSHIAEAELGDPMRFPEIYEASRDTVQSNGRQLSDPDLILPGWRLTIPGSEGPDRPDVEHPDPEPNEDATPQPDVTAEPTPSVEPTPEPSSDVEAPASADFADGAENDEQGMHGWLLPGLTGAGTLLAGSLWLTLRARRRTQLRYRRPGHVIAPPPPWLRDVEKSAHVGGAPVASAIETLDRLLRHLAAELDARGGHLPELTTAELSADQVTIHLSAPSELASPWEGAGTEWTARLDVDIRDVDQVPPYPLLVTLGQAADGHLLLGNLEALGPVALTGDREKSEDLARHIAAELLLNPWASLVDVHLMGLGDELAPLEPLRLYSHPQDDTAFLSQFATDLERTASAGRPETFLALVSAGTSDQAALLRVASAHSHNSGAAVVAVLANDLAGVLPLTLGPYGALHSDALDVELMASGLTVDEAAACAAIVDITRDAVEMAAPIEGDLEDGHRTVANQLGALREDLTEPRPDDAAGAESLLPLSTSAYADQAATTVQDVELLAPLVPPSARQRAEDSDPVLDADIAAWFDPDCLLPKLTLLGTVGARTRGDARAVAKRKPLAIELLAYLALHPRGVTSEQIAEAFALTRNRVRVDLTAVRAWLGTNPRTGQPHLPPANQSRAAQTHGGWLYQVDDVLVDADLFRRLRARGQARGAAGLFDLQTALQLVSGQPFSDLRPGGWSWVLEGDRIDEHLTCAIADVGHIVATRRLAEHDVSSARTAVETARMAAPYDEILRLDLVAVIVAEGHPELAERLLIDDVCNRSDDDHGPVELPQRTADLIHAKNWLNSQNAST